MDGMADGYMIYVQDRGVPTGFPVKNRFGVVGNFGSFLALDPRQP